MTDICEVQLVFDDDDLELQFDDGVAQLEEEDAIVVPPECE
jgi:hypothetical protein